jgi:hypothetical protein
LKPDDENIIIYTPASHTFFDRKQIFEKNLFVGRFLSPSTAFLFIFVALALESTRMVKTRCKREMNEQIAIILRVDVDPFMFSIKRVHV